MPADAKVTLLPSETAETPAARRDAPQQQPERPAAVSAAPREVAGPSLLVVFKTSVRRGDGHAAVEV
jgi:hypothetical protein